jgi:hypothetical protein
MSSLISGEKLFAGSVVVAIVAAASMASAVAQEKAAAPDFSSGNVGWLTFNVDFSVVPGATSPLRSDPAHPRVSNQEAVRTGKQPTYFVADLANAGILKAWVV